MKKILALFFVALSLGLVCAADDPKAKEKVSFLINCNRKHLLVMKCSWKQSVKFSRMRKKFSLRNFKQSLQTLGVSHSTPSD